MRAIISNFIPKIISQHLIFLGLGVMALLSLLVFLSEGEARSELSEALILDVVSPKQEGLSIQDTIETVQTYSLVFGGDVMLARTVGDNILNNEFNPFQNIKKYLKNADLAVVNLEVVVSDQGYPVAGKYYTFRSDPKTLRVLTSAGIDAVSVANNHAGDYGSIAFTDMLSRLNKSGIGYFGGGKDEKEAYSPRIIFVGDLKVALVGFNMIETPYFTARGDNPGHAWVDDSKVKQVIKQAKNLADFVVVMPHWGLEYTPEIHPGQTRVGKLMIDAGADLVVGGHPHHIQKTINYKGKKLIYSVGNLVFDGPGPNAGWYLGNLVEVEVSSKGDQVDFKLVPYSIDNSGLVTFL